MYEHFFFKFKNVRIYKLGLCKILAIICKNNSIASKHTKFVFGRGGGKYLYFQSHKNQSYSTLVYLRFQYYYYWIFYEIHFHPCRRRDVLLIDVFFFLFRGGKLLQYIKVQFYLPLMKIINCSSIINSI